MRIIFCDRCGKILKPEEYDNTGYISMFYKPYFQNGMNGESILGENVDFCEKCMNEIEAFIREKPEQEKPACCSEAASDEPEAASEETSDPKCCFEAAQESAPDDEPEDDGDDEVVERMKGTWSRKKLPLDTGKVKALKTAGWSVAKIADEMHVSVHTIYKALKEAENGAD